MDQGLKERLIGAAVLVALGVWLIPWVLDGKKEQIELDGSEAALRLPTPEQPLPIRTQTLSLDQDAPEPFANERPDAARANAVEREPSAAPAEPAAVARNEAAPAAPEEAQPDPTPAAPASTEPAKEPAVARTAEPAASAGATAAAPAAAAPAPKPAVEQVAAKPAPRTDANGDWAVQLGSFGEEANAKRLAQRVTTFGYKPEVSSYRTGGRSMYRVRVGPYGTRGQADAAASALSAHGFTGQVVAAN